MSWETTIKVSIRLLKNSKSKRKRKNFYGLIPVSIFFKVNVYESITIVFIGINCNNFKRKNLYIILDEAHISFIIYMYVIADKVREGKNEIGQIQLFLIEY